MQTATIEPATEQSPALVEVDALTIRYHGETRTILVEPHPEQPGRHRLSIVDEEGHRHGLYWTVYSQPGTHGYTSELGLVASIILDAIVGNDLVP